MEPNIILFLAFVPFCAVGMFYLFHCDWDAMLFSYGRRAIWLGFDFDDVTVTAFKILGAIVLSIPVAGLLAIT